jgi:hypothetical protein
MNDPDPDELHELPDDFHLDIDQEILKRMIDEINSEPEVECAHCSNIPDGTITIVTDKYQRNHRICNACAKECLEWL